MTLEGHISYVIRKGIELSIDEGQPYIKYDEVAIDDILTLIKQETVKARVDELEAIVYQIKTETGAEPDEYLSNRIAQLQAGLDQSNGKTN